MRKQKNIINKCAAVMMGLAVIAPLNGAAQSWSSMPNVHGGQNFFSGGQFKGSSMPNVHGGYNYNFRGANGSSVLFDGEVYGKFFSEVAWLEAVDMRDVPQMTALAWVLKGLETIAGEADTKTTSAMMFDVAAQVAVAQGNDEALKAIVSLSPSAAKYNNEMAVLATTRGKGGFVPAMPQIVLAPEKPKEFDKFMRGIAAYQVPYITPAVLSAKLPETPASDLLNICTLVNQGRLTKSPSMITLAALELAQNPSTAKSAFLNPARMIEEAAELAILLDDKVSLEFIANVYGQKTSPLADKSKSAMYSAEVVAMATTRGLSSVNLLQQLATPPCYFDFLTDDSARNLKY